MATHDDIGREATHAYYDEREPEDRPGADEFDDPTFKPTHVLDESDGEYEHRTTAAALFGCWS